MPSENTLRKGKRSMRTLALFDFDGTMAPGDSIVAYLRIARRLGALSKKEYARIGRCALKWLRGGMSDQAFKQRALLFRMTLPYPRREALDQCFAQDVLLPMVYPAARACLEKRRAEGCLTLLVSASTENYMRYVAWGLGFDGLLCTPISSSGEVGTNCKGEEKCRRVKAYLAEQGVEADFAASYAYGNGRSDAPMLAMCGRPVLVNARFSLKRRFPHAPRERWTKKTRRPPEK